MRNRELLAASVLLLHGATNGELTALRELFPYVDDATLLNLPQGAEAVAMMRAQMEEQATAGPAAQRDCLHCRGETRVRRFDALSVYDSSSDEIATLVDSGTAFVVSNATAECAGFEGMGRPYYWARYVRQVEVLRRSDVTRREHFRDRAFIGMSAAYGPELLPRWSAEDLQWCGRSSGVACGAGDLPRTSRSSSVEEVLDLTLTSAANHTADFYVGWSNIDPEIAALVPADLGFSPAGCVPVLASPRYRPKADGCQWWRVGRATKAPHVGEPQHIDRVGGRTECHLMLAGRKVWRLKAPDWCGHECESFGTVEVALGPGDLFCVGVDRYYHTTYLPIEPAMSVDVAYDVWGVEPAPPAQNAGEVSGTGSCSGDSGDS